MRETHLGVLLIFGAQLDVNSEVTGGRCFLVKNKNTRTTPYELHPEAACFDCMLGSPTRFSRVLKLYSPALSYFMALPPLHPPPPPPHQNLVHFALRPQKRDGLLGTGIGGGGGTKE